VDPWRDRGTMYITNGLNVYAEYDQTNTCTGEYVYGLNGMVTKLIPSKGYVWFIKDHLGSTRQIIDSVSTNSMKRDYYPFGENQTAAGDSIQFQFTGKELDNKSGLYYFGARYYDPSMGRWLAPDPMAGKFPDISPYNYCHNNPLRMVDPTGMEDNESNSEAKRREEKIREYEENQKRQAQQNSVQVSGNVKVAMDINNAVKEGTNIIGENIYDVEKEGVKILEELSDVTTENAGGVALVSLIVIVKTSPDTQE
jgi:RHS repeat-associated protein